MPIEAFGAYVRCMCANSQISRSCKIKATQGYEYSWRLAESIRRESDSSCVQREVTIRSPKRAASNLRLAPAMDEPGRTQSLSISAALSYRSEASRGNIRRLHIQSVRTITPRPEPEVLDPA